MYEHTDKEVCFKFPECLYSFKSDSLFHVISVKLPPITESSTLDFKCEKLYIF